MVQRNQTWPPVSGRWHPVWSAFGCSNPTSVAAVKKLIMANRRVKVSEIVKELQIAVGSVENYNSQTSSHVESIFSLSASKFLFARSAWTHGLTSEASAFVHRKVLSSFGDITWIHQRDSARKVEFMQWKHVESPPPKKFRTQPSAGKVVWIIFTERERRYMLSSVRLSVVCLSSVVCNVRAPFSGDWNFRQCFTPFGTLAIFDLSINFFTKIASEEPLR